MNECVDFWHCVEMGTGIGIGIFWLPFLLALILKIVCIRITIASSDCEGHEENG